LFVVRASSYWIGITPGAEDGRGNHMARRMGSLVRTPGRWASSFGGAVRRGPASWPVDQVEHGTRSDCKARAAALRITGTVTAVQHAARRPASAGSACRIPGSTPAIAIVGAVQSGALRSSSPHQTGAVRDAPVALSRLWRARHHGHGTRRAQAINDRGPSVPVAVMPSVFVPHTV